MNDDNRDDVIDDAIEQPFMVASEDPAELRTPSSKDELRKQLMDEVNAFLAKGGQIQQVEPMLRNDLPRKPIVDYGDTTVS